MIFSECDHSAQKIDGKGQIGNCLQEVLLLFHVRTRVICPPKMIHTNLQIHKTQKKPGRLEIFKNVRNHGAKNCRRAVSSLFFTAKKKLQKKRQKRCHLPPHPPSAHRSTREEPPWGAELAGPSDQASCRPRSTHWRKMSLNSAEGGGRGGGGAAGQRTAVRPERHTFTLPRCAKRRGCFVHSSVCRVRAGVCASCHEFVTFFGRGDFLGGLQYRQAQWRHIYLDTVHPLQTCLNDLMEQCPVEVE